jgi:spermidine dehydrogenase
MNARDRKLGMHADITRRDFLNGVSVAIGATLLPSPAVAQDVGAQDLAGYYPPELSGMRGSHPGSFTVAHMARDGITWEGEDTGEEFDLVIVGAGISGLSAAYFYRQAMGNNARILLLDNHDDFGGHAKRNEFEIEGRLMIGYGGTMLLEAPDSYPPAAKRLIRELGIDSKRFYTAYDQDLYSSLGLARGIFFDRETFGSDHLAVGDVTNPDVLQQVPLSDEGKADLVRYFADDHHYLADVPPEERLDYLIHTDYQTYLRERGDFGDEVLQVIQSRAKSVWAVGIDALPSRTAWSNGYPGFANLDLHISSEEEEEEEEEESFFFHFPDGNASVARLLVRSMIPDVAPGNDMEDIVTARFKYQRLDNPESAVRIRLNSTAVRVRHIDDDTRKPVHVTYVRDGKARRVQAGQVVMACYHAIIPNLCREMPKAQRDLLAKSVRAPLVYSNVLIRNWNSFVKLGLNRASCPGSYHSGVSLDFPVSLGDYSCSKSPDEPMILHLTRVPGEPGLSAREQFTAGKRDLLGTSFETFERNIRDQLGRMLGAGGFDPARDIAGITVNRWPHGYAYGVDPVTDRIAFEPKQWPEEERSWATASQRFGNISIAASDAASNAMTESAIEEAFRAVSELSETI